MEPTPSTWCEIDLAAVRTNVRTLQSQLRRGTTFCAVVKSNAYGHGAVPVAVAALEAGADWLGVVSAHEALALRAAKIVAPVLVMAVTRPDDWSNLATSDARVTIADSGQVAALRTYQGPLLRVHLKVETGLGRLGFAPAEIPGLITQLLDHPVVRVEGLISHFASVEEQDLDYTRHQLQEFEQAWAGHTLLRHIAATAALLQLPESHLDMVRAGIGIYGLWPSAEVRVAVAQLHPTLVLQPALSWRTRLVQAKSVESGTSVGYGRTHRVDRKTRVGVLAVGYADGYDRGLSNRGQVLVRGQRCPIIGRVAMNMTMVDLTGVFDAHVGDVATLIGRDGGEEITADDLAEWATTINYEIVTRILIHVPRRYVGSEQ